MVCSSRQFDSHMAKRFQNFETIRTSPFNGIVFLRFRRYFIQIYAVGRSGLGLVSHHVSDPISYPKLSDNRRYQKWLEKNRIFFPTLRCTNLRSPRQFLCGCD